MTEQRKMSAAFWTTLFVGTCLAYAASFGPVCALVELDILPPILETAFFHPHLHIAMHGARLLKEGEWAWANICGGEWALAEAVSNARFEGR